MATSPIFLDSNVFLYAAGADHSLRGPCQRALRQVAAGELAAVTSTEVVQEILHLLVRRGRSADGLELARKVIALFPELLPVTRRDMAAACDLLERYPGITVRDAVHAATAQSNGIDHILTTDRHFDRIEGLERVGPEAW